MGILSSLTSALIAFNPSSVDINSEKDFREAIIMLLAKLPVLASWTHRKMKGLPLNYPNYELPYTENLAYMMFRMPNKEFKASKTLVSALNKLLILHADHEQNCSTSTVRMVGSSHAGLFASIASGISALWGPLHGGANQAVIEMLEEIKKDGGDTQKFMAMAKDKNDPFRLMGFGHRVYKNFDPRAKIIKKQPMKYFPNWVSMILFWILLKDWKTKPWKTHILWTENCIPMWISTLESSTVR